MSNMDRFTIHSQLQHLQSKYPGTGNADTTRLDWGLNIQRDTLASHVGHYSRLAYFAVAENESIRRIRYRCLSEMVSPGGPGTGGAAAAEGASASSAEETVKDGSAKKAPAKEVSETEKETPEETPQEKDEDVAMEEGEDL